MGLTISQLVRTLSNVQAAVGDLPVALKHAESDAESFLHSIGLDLGLDGTAAGSTVTLNHSDTPPAEPEPEPAPEQAQAPTPVPTSADQPHG